MSPESFFQLTPVEYSLAAKDYQDLEVSKIRPIAEAVRMSTWWLVNIQIPRGKRKVRKREIMEFVWDPWVKKRKDKKPQTVEEMKRVAKMIAFATKDDKRKNKRKKNGSKSR